MQLAATSQAKYYKKPFSPNLTNSMRAHKVFGLVSRHWQCCYQSMGYCCLNGHEVQGKVWIAPDSRIAKGTCRYGKLRLDEHTRPGLESEAEAKCLILARN